MAYNGTLQVVIDSTTNKVKRYGYVDMEADNIFDGGSETIITQYHDFNPDINVSDWTWNGSTFIEGGSAEVKEDIAVIQQIDVGRTTNKSTYSKLARVIYVGKEKMGTMKSIEAVSHMDSGAISYDIKVVDRKNGSIVVAEVTGLTNTDSEIVDLGNISNLTNNKTILEIQLRRIGNGSKKAYLDSLILKY
jgi:hypothetical protein